MAFDANRPVPWKRLAVPFAVYAVVATAAFTLFGSQASVSGIVLGVLMGGALYLGVAVLLVKFGWNPPQWGASARPERAPKATPAKGSTGSSSTPAGPRPRPAPTTRTNAGNPKAKRSR